MDFLDYAIIAGYLIALLGMGYFFKENTDKKDYFLGGRSMGTVPLTLSTMATQLSAISFISAPAFVGLKSGGGMVWLAYEFAVPLAMILLLMFILPPLYRSGVVSIYEYLEGRFGISTRMLISTVFQISRSFGTGIMVYATALILEGMMGISFWTSISVIGIITIIYSLQGGMKAVVYSDAIQMGLIFFGVIIVGAFALHNLGGVDELVANVDTSRLDVIRADSFGFNGDEWGLMPMIFGGIVLYASYYGCDQTQAQRSLSASSEKTLRQILLMNGLLRFPMVMLYCLTGLVLGTFTLTTPEFLSLIPKDKPDLMVPLFIVNYLPHGIIGILVVALMAAAMSSLSSTLNSLTAVSMEDFTRLTGREFSEKQYVSWSRIMVFFWGIVIVTFSVFGGDIADTVIEAINKIGSVFYGPILATFMMAIMFKRIGSRDANLGLITGVGINMYLWLMVPEVFWLWWNFIGCVSALSVGLAMSYLRKHTSRLSADIAPSNEGALITMKELSLMLGAFATMLLISTLLPTLII
ncbi:sodium:solute symporter family transporter [Kordiimonas laminariae]|uniref:sodium:solute symporter family transporter n=1 Tax=Kordiimonas laminariae TaxID=2917717 RepID=UPI001FF44379|nr:sodium/solute symporter [Kordiimonas laminariae]MCK0068486.1 sodium/solute symporter [Kordiimonas laminariae]